MVKLSLRTWKAVQINTELTFHIGHNS